MSTPGCARTAVNPAAGRSANSVSPDSRHPCPGGMGQRFATSPNLVDADGPNLPQVFGQAHDQRDGGRPGRLGEHLAIVLEIEIKRLRLDAVDLPPAFFADRHDHQARRQHQRLLAAHDHDVDVPAVHVQGTEPAPLMASTTSSAGVALTSRPIASMS